MPNPEEDVNARRRKNEEWLEENWKGHPQAVLTAGAPKTVRAKFRCDASVEGLDGHNIALYAVGSDSPENATFFSATPSGQILLNIVAKAAAKFFTPGQTYYVDFSSAPAEDVAAAGPPLSLPSSTGTGL